MLSKHCDIRTFALYTSTVTTSTTPSCVPVANLQLHTSKVSKVRCFFNIKFMVSKVLSTRLFALVLQAKHLYNIANPHIPSKQPLSVYPERIYTHVARTSCMPRTYRTPSLRYRQSYLGSMEPETCPAPPRGLSCTTGHPGQLR